MFTFLLERIFVYDRDGKSSLFKYFLGSLPITTESIFNQENAVFEVLIRKIKVQSSIILCMQRTGLAGLKAIARVSILSL